MLLVVNLDGSLLEGQNLYTHEFRSWIGSYPVMSLIGISCRGLESLMPIFENAQMPQMDYIICDMGATIVYGNTFSPVEPIQTNIEKNWPGSLKIQLFVHDIPNLLYRKIPAQRRCSFYTDNLTTVELVRRNAEELGCDIYYSSDNQLDVVPRGVSKASTLKKLMEHKNMHMNDVLVVGETIEDLDLVAHGFKTVLTKDTDQKLIDATSNMLNVFQTNNKGAKAIAESIKHFAGGMNINNFWAEKP